MVNFQQKIDYDFSHLRNIVCCVNNINQYTKKDVPDYEIGEYGYLKRTNPILNKEAPEPPDLNKLPEIYKTIPDDVAYFVKTPEAITLEHEIIDVAHINQEEVDILKQAYSGVKPILDQLDKVSAAGTIALFSLFEYAWDEVALKRNIVRMTHHKIRREKNLKFTTGWKKNLEKEGEPQREIIILDGELPNNATISEDIDVNDDTIVEVFANTPDSLGKPSIWVGSPISPIPSPPLTPSQIR
jgi:hypothetical protein